MMTKRPDWIGVADKEQVFVGVKGRLAQLAHGRKIPLRGLNEADWLIHHSPRSPANGEEGCQCFTDIDRIARQAVDQVNSGAGFFRNRPEVDLELCGEASILPSTGAFSLIENRKSWQSAFRLRHLEISEEDFELLAEEMGPDVDSLTH
jgi:hypothetical protein